MYPLPNLSPSVSRCAFLLLKMTHRWRNFCTSGCCRRSSPFRWWPAALKRNAMLQTSRMIWWCWWLARIWWKTASAGADDFVAKPFEVAELAARIRAVVRRGNRAGRAVLQVNDLELDRISRRVQRQGQQIDLSPKEFCLLELLMRHAGQPVSRSAIVEQVWKLNCDTMTNVVDVYINYLRRKVDVGFELPLIRTVRAVGYQIGASVAGV